MNTFIQNKRESAKEFFVRKTKGMFTDEISATNWYFLMFTNVSSKTIEEFVLMTLIHIEDLIDKGFVVDDEEKQMELLNVVWRTCKHLYPFNYLKQYNFLHCKEAHFNDVVIHTLESYLKDIPMRNIKILHNILERLETI